MRRSFFARVARVLALVPLTACIHSGGFDLSPKYQGENLLVPAVWGGPDPFVHAVPSDGLLRKDWWQLFGDDVLNRLEERALSQNPELQAAAERFVQARDEMMKARSKLVPHLGGSIAASDNKQSSEALFRSSTSRVREDELLFGGVASWEPDFWSKLRNATRVEIYRAEELAANYALARLSLQAEVAAAYFTLRGLDAQNAIYRQSIVYYQESLDLVEVKFRGRIASELDVARARYQLYSSQARQYGVQGKRQVVEHALARLLNAAPANFSIAAVDDYKAPQFDVPLALPSSLLQRRPDVAAMERQMAQANKTIGIARAAFYPNIPLRATGGISGKFASIFRVPNFFWSVGAFLKIPVFEGGYRRARLQQTWSAYRETEDLYRNTVLLAFREVEDGLSLTHMTAAEMDRQIAAVAAAVQQQDLSMELYRGGLASSLDLINAQVNALDARVTAAQVRANWHKSTVGLVRALGGGWQRSELPHDDDVQPFGVFQYTHLSKPKPAGAIDVANTERAPYQNVGAPMQF